MGLTKPELRKKIQDDRKLLAPGKHFSDTAADSAEIQTRFLEYIENKNIKSIILYYSAPSEPSTTELIPLLIKSGYEIFLPISEALNVAKIGSIKDLKPGPYGIPEPDINKIQKNTKMNYDLIVMPGLAFDKKGYRLGHGGGWYDKFLNKNRIRLKVGFCFERYIIPALPVDSWDQKADLVITEDRIIGKSNPVNM